MGRRKRKSTMSNRKHTDSRPLSWAVVIVCLLCWPLMAGADAISRRLAQGAKLMKQGKVDGAMAAFSKAIKAAPRDPRGYYQRGVCREKKKDTTGAMADYRQAVKLRPTFAEAHNNLGAMLHGKGKIDQAVKHLKQATRNRSDYGEAWYNLGLAYYDLRRYKESAGAYRRAVKLKPADVDCRINLGGALLHLKDFPGAVKQLGLAVKLAPRNAMARFSYGSLLMKQGKLAEAAVQLRMAVKLDPGYARAWHRLGIVRARLKDFSTAIKNLQRAAGFKALAPMVLCDLGKVYRKQGKTREAVAQYNKAIKAAPGYAKPYLLLGLAQASAGKCKAARKAFKGFISRQKGVPPGTLSKLMKSCKK